jgi:hypothetical protein
MNSTKNSASMFLLVLISKQTRGFLPPVDKYQTGIIIVL